jgi:hypothetical protein
MTKLISGRVAKVPSSNVSSDRYQFLDLSEAEPDLGLPPERAHVLTSDLNGYRSWIQLDSGNVLESTNQYFTNTRARSVFTAGKGIAINGDGVIINTGASFEFNLGIDGSGYGNVLSTMSGIVTMPNSPINDRHVLRSLHITNISNQDALISGNILYSTGNTALFANKLPVPVGGAVELMRNVQLLQPSDKVNLQGFASDGTATSNLLQSIYTYETFATDFSYVGNGITLENSNTNIQIYDSAQGFSIVESIKLVNLVNSTVPVKVYWGDANGNPKAYLAHNLPIPPNSTVEIITAPKRIELSDKLYANYTNADAGAVSAFISARLGSVYSIAAYTPSASSSNTFLASFTTTENDGTVIYYSIE